MPVFAKPMFIAAKIAMPALRVDFYIVQNAPPHGRVRFGCKLLEKAYRSDADVFVQTSSQEQSLYLDDLLWTFKAGSFIPHRLQQAQGTEKIVLGHVPPDSHQRGIYLNLSDHQIDSHSQFERVIEIVTEDVREMARNWYRQYQQQAYQIQTHTLKF